MNAETHPPATTMSAAASALPALIDLNDVWPLLPARHDLSEVRRRLADTARDWLPATSVVSQIDRCFVAQPRL